MSYYGSSEEHQPVTWLRGHAIYAAHFVVLVFVATMLSTTLLLAINAAGLEAWVVYTSDLVLHGQVWRVLTYGLWNPPSFLFAIDMLMLVWFGRELEKFFGRRKFLSLYGSVYLLSPLVFTAIGRWMPNSLVGESGAFAIFIAFATLYPNVDLLFGLLAKWIAWVLVGIYTLIGLASHDWSMLISLWVTTAYAFTFVRVNQGRIQLPRLRLPQRKPKVRVISGGGEVRRGPPPAAAASSAEIDALLDKIAQSGFASLTPKEKAKLEAARQELKKRAGR